MGNSSSRRNNRNNYNHPFPPPPPVYSSYPIPPPPDPSSYTPPSSSTPPNYVFAANAPYPHPHPPAAPLHPSYYQYTNTYNGPRSNFHPGYYGNHNPNGWGGSRPPVSPVIPPPYIDHQTAKKIRNEVNVHKDTIKLDVDHDNSECCLVSFTFDALVDGSIIIIYFAKEEADCSFVPLYPDAHMSVKVPFQKGLGQKFRQPSGTGVDLGFFDLDDLSKPSREETVFPLVIVADAWTSSLPSEEQYNHPRPTNSQITQAIIEKNSEGEFQAKVVKQILRVDGVRYELREIYGIAKSADTSFDDSDPGKECVICMSEPKDTAVLPCRHMCLCSECAKELRLQTNKCPICRQPIQELIEIKVTKDGQ